MDKQKQCSLISLKMDKVSVFIYAIFLFISSANCQFDLSPDLPSHLPSPPKAPAPSPPASSPGSGGPSGPGGANGQIGGILQGTPPIPPPQNVGPLGPGVLPGELVPFGLNHIILIIVPQFKTKYNKLPGWIQSSVKISMPVTVFFDLLEVPPGMFFPAPGGLLPVPFGSPPILVPPGGGPIPPPINPLSPIAIDPPMTVGQISPSYSYYRRRPYLYGNGYSSNEDDVEDIDADGYENYFDDEPSIDQRRRKREIFTNDTSLFDTIYTDNYDHLLITRKKRALPFNHTVHKTERASIMPKLEKILNNAGLEGKACLLRAVCEVHEAPLDHYGLMGQLITMFFSVSRSVFADSHLPEYLQAEEAGKMGDCSEFYKQCENTLFSWEEKVEPVDESSNSNSILHL